MEGETLLTKAYSNLKLAELAFNTADDGLLNLVAYHLQQAIELTIKHQYVCAGVDYEYTHDIIKLLDNIDTVYKPHTLSKMAPILNDWEANTRYMLNYKTDAEKLAKVLKFTRKYLKDVSDYLSDKVSLSKLTLQEFADSSGQPYDVAVKALTMLCSEETRKEHPEWTDEDAALFVCKNIL